MKRFSSAPGGPWISEAGMLRGGLTTVSAAAGVSSLASTAPGREVQPGKTSSATYVARVRMRLRSPRARRMSKVPILSQDRAKRQTMAPGSRRSRWTRALGVSVRERARVVGMLRALSAVCRRGIVSFCSAWGVEGMNRAADLRKQYIHECWSGGQPFRLQIGSRVFCRRL